MARPTKFDKRYLAQAFEMGLLGLTDEEMAKVFGVTVRTLRNWDKDHPDFYEARRKGGVVADGKVARGLYERACGYSHPETVINVHLGTVIKTRVTRQYPPDTNAAAKWLFNRQPGRWRAAPEPGDGTEEATPVKVVIEVKSARKRSDDDGAPESVPA